jgi:hypothetical protein
LTFRGFDIRLFPVWLTLAFFPAGSLAQEQPPPGQAPPPAAGAAPTPRPSEPDYPDPRTLAIGLFYWGTGPGTNPSLISGKLSSGNETLRDLGKPHRTPGIEISFPITRTGSLHAEYFLTKGVGNQNAPDTIFLFGTQYTQGDYLASQYQIQNAKFYLDDLLFPHKFPVARFRLKSLWEVQFVKIKATFDAPAFPGETSSGSRQIFLPTIGLAAEYAVSPHLLFRAAGSGFGLYHRADIWDAEAILAYRHGQWEISGGAKAFHFKSSPKTEEYVTATLAGPFVSLRWHWR